MPSQEDYLDNLLKGIGNTEEEENSRKESEEGVKDCLLYTSPSPRD